MMFYTEHARLRLAQWNLTRQDVEYIVQYGKAYRKAGALFHFLRSKDLPADDAGRRDARRLVGASVVLSRDGMWVITVWRNRQNGLKRIKRKCRFSTPAQGAAGWIG